MRKYLLLIFIFTFLSSISYSQSGWIVQTIGGEYDVFNTINFFNINTGMVISGYGGNPSYNGKIFRTNNSGLNWTYTNFINPDNFIDGYYFDENNFVLVGQRSSGPGIIASYKNSIRSDYIINPLHGNMTALTSTNWLDANTGFVGGWDFGAGHWGRVLKTTNQGVNWIDISPILNSDVSAVKFFDLNTGYIIDGGEFKKTTNSGLNWITISSILLTQADFHLVTKDTFYICGYSGYVRISSDSGYTWQLRPVGYNVTLLRSIRFINSKTGWTCGDSGNIFKTTNAGLNWQKQISGTNVTLSNISIVNENFLWIGGSLGIVLRTTTGGVTFIQRNTNEIPIEFKLFQNYPNPFNPNTKIQFDIPKSSYVKLTVYNITGKEIEILANEKVSPGIYETEFNGENCPSGIYFYRLETPDFIQTYKMILLK